MGLARQQARAQDVVIRRRRDSGLEADRGEQARADPAGVPVARERDHRHAHPERLAGRGGAVVGEGVERNVDLVVERQMVFGLDFGRQDPEPLAADAVGREGRLEHGPGLGVAGAGRFQHQAGALDLLENPGPEGDHPSIDLGQVVERAEGDVAVTLHRQRPDLRRVAGRRIGEKAARQTDQELPQ